MPKTNYLTDRQRQVLDFITDRIDGGMPPTIREIAEAIGIVSPNGVAVHLKALQRKGFIDRTRHRARFIRLTEPEMEDDCMLTEANSHSSAGAIDRDIEHKLLWCFAELLLAIDDTLAEHGKHHPPEECYLCADLQILRGIVDVHFASAKESIER